MSTYSDKHKEYYRKNKDKILAQRKIYESEWINTPKGQFSIQKRKAKRRKIEWLLSFEDWFSIWMKSGQWDNRGMSAQSFCMCRLNDTGPYAVENVRIDTMRNNSKENYLILGINEKGQFKKKDLS